jgi:hypothetical protein
MIRIHSIARTPKPRKKADTRALQIARQTIHAELYEEVMTTCVEEALERQQSHFHASQHFRRTGDRLN